MFNEDLTPDPSPKGEGRPIAASGSYLTPLPREGLGVGSWVFQSFSSPIVPGRVSIC